MSVDFGRKFIPENITPLFFTPAYRELTAAQRLRYNQLHALYFNEQIVFFETAIGRGMLETLQDEPWPDGFGERLRRFWDDERRHSEMFRQLNRRCAPEVYGKSEFHFIRLPRLRIAALRWATRRPRAFPLFLWLMFLQEERSLYYSKEFIRQRADLEPEFVATFKAHLADEVRHVSCDRELIERLWRHASPRVRRLNGRLFAWMVGEYFFTPKRAQLRVIDELAREFPELRARRRELRRQMLALSADADYQRSLYSRQIVPQCFAWFDEWPEFRGLQRVMAGYRAP
jgi:hypothetical protein